MHWRESEEIRFSSLGELSLLRALLVELVKQEKEKHNVKS